MLVTAQELIFVVCRPGQADDFETYPPGTPVECVIAEQDEAGRAFHQRARELQERTGNPHRLIRLGGKLRLVAAIKLRNVEGPR